MNAATSHQLLAFSFQRVLAEAGNVGWMDKGLEANS
jgi:hypothetical protein